MEVAIPPVARIRNLELGALLGEGGAGQVYAAEQVLPGGARRPVAVKVLTRGGAELQREAWLGGLLRHENLVDVYEVGEDGGRWYCVLERCDRSLAQLVPLPPRAVVDAGLQVCRALQYAHEALGLVHLDLKPSNLLLRGDVVKVSDLGIAVADGFDGEVRPRGTPGYMAPEQALGGPVDARSDIYALGMTLLELATGSQPLASATQDWSDGGTSSTLSLDVMEATPAPVDSEIPAWLRRVVPRCLAEDPAARWPDMASLAEALATLPAEGPGLREVLGSPEPTPAPATEGLVGRDDARAALLEAMAEPGVVSVKGAPGVGKSALADDAARAWAGATDRPAWRCGLGEARSIEGLAFAVARSLDVALGKGSPLEQLGFALAARGDCALVLDDADLVPDLGAVVARWRAAAPRARLIVTSRAQVELDGVRVVDVGPLPPDAARRLLAARAAERGVDVSADPDLGALVDRLDGLPLAIELAAGRLGVLGVRDVLDRLGLALLRRGSTGRHGTLQAALDASWELLSEAERDALSQLSVFADGFGLDAFRAVVDLRGAPPEVALGALVDRSLVQVRGPRRFALMATVRAYAEGQLPEPGPAEARHGRWFARDPDAGRRAARGERGADALREQALDLDNLVVACRRAVARGDGASALGAFESAWTVLSETGPFATGLELARLIASSDALDPSQRVLAQARLGRCAVECGDLGTAEEALASAEAGAEALGDRSLGLQVLVHRATMAGRQGHRLAEALALASEGVARADELGASDARIACLLLRGLALGYTGDWRSAIEALRACRDQARAHGDLLVEAAALQAEAMGHHVLGDTRTAEVQLRAALETARARRSLFFQGRALTTLGILHRERGELEASVADFEASITSYESLGAPSEAVIPRANLGLALHDLGRHADALACYEVALPVARRSGASRVAASILGNLGSLHLDAGRLPEAEAALCEAIEAHRVVGNARSEGLALANLGELKRRAGDRAAALAHLDDALAIARRLGDKHGEATALSRLADLAGEVDPALGVARFEEAIACIAGQSGRLEAEWHAARARLLVRLGDPAAARDALAAARAALTSPAPPIEAAIARAQAELDAAALVGTDPA